MACPKCGHFIYHWFHDTTSKCDECQYVGPDEEFDEKKYNPKKVTLKVGGCRD